MSDKGAGWLHPTPVRVLLVVSVVVVLVGLSWRRVLQGPNSNRRTCQADGSWRATRENDLVRGTLSLSRGRMLRFQPGNGKRPQVMDLEKYSVGGIGDVVRATLTLQPVDGEAQPVVFSLEGGQRFSDDQIRCFQGVP